MFDFLNDFLRFFFTIFDFFSSKPSIFFRFFSSNFWRINSVEASFAALRGWFLYSNDAKKI